MKLRIADRLRFAVALTALILAFIALRAVSDFQRDQERANQEQRDLNQKMVKSIYLIAGTFDNFLRTFEPSAPLVVPPLPPMPLKPARENIHYNDMTFRNGERQMAFCEQCALKTDYLFKGEVVSKATRYTRPDGTRLTKPRVVNIRRKGNVCLRCRPLSNLERLELRERKAEHAGTR